MCYQTNQKYLKLVIFAKVNKFIEVVLNLLSDKLKIWFNFNKKYYQMTTMILVNNLSNLILDFHIVIMEEQHNTKKKTH
jgi:hypothetical protein